jgi:hypothetical protein
MRRWELWQSENQHDYFPSTSEKSRVMARVEGAVKVWETEASSTNEAMRARNRHLGFDPYKPMLRDDGTPYPEDDDDEILKEQEGDLFDAPWPGVCSVQGVMIQVPGNPDPDEVVRTGKLESSCPACGESHTWLFSRLG